MAQVIVITAGAEAGTSGITASASAGPGTGVQAKQNIIKEWLPSLNAQGGLIYEFSIGGRKTGRTLENGSVMSVRE